MLVVHTGRHLSAESTPSFSSAASAIFSSGVEQVPAMMATLAPPSTACWTKSFAPAAARMIQGSACRSALNGLLAFHHCFS